MKSRHLFPFALALLITSGPQPGSVSTGAPPTVPADARFQKEVLPYLTKHCYSCHGDGKKRAGLALDRYQDDLAVQKDRKTWDNILNMIRTGEMPPKEKPRPDVQETEAVLKSIDAVLASLDCSGPRNVGRVTLRRLNRVEYNNTIRDLLGVDFKPAADFPSDDVGYGFDNIGDVLSLSPLLLERYLAAAESVLERAIVHVETPKPTVVQLPGMRVSRDAGEMRRGEAMLINDRGDAYAESFLEEGDYTIRVTVTADQVGDAAVRASVRVGFIERKEFEVKNDSDKPQTLELKVRLRAGTARVAVSLRNPFTDPDDAAKQRRLYVRSIAVDGPHNPPPPPTPETHRRIMTHSPNIPPREAAAEIVSRFATRAFRRPVKPEEVERILKVYDAAEKAGERFENRIRLALCRVLVSPHFLFRVELDPADAKPGTAYPVDEFALASRLSYFLWSTMPDDELFSLAGKGELRQNLEVQVRRMLKDPRSSAFVQNFAGQWLTLRTLATVTPDRKTFPNFDAELRGAMQRETELFFEAILRDDRSVLDLLDADFSFVNERLAKHYGIEGVVGKEFQRVKMPPERGGILTQASILTLTSNPTRTSPVKRGKWILEQILNTPPPPPPPDVPELQDEKQLTGTLRQVMEQHRASPVCASCHNRLDPIGFAFENFDAIGAFRTKDGGFDIDPSGVLPDGKKFQGPAELKAILKGKKELFVGCLIEKMLTYALGRGLEYYDKCAVDAIHTAMTKNEYRFSTLVVEIVKSEPFQMRTATGGKRR